MQSMAELYKLQYESDRNRTEITPHLSPYFNNIEHVFIYVSVNITLESAQFHGHALLSYHLAILSLAKGVKKSNK